jgi:clan AA aspartic protease
MGFVNVEVEISNLEAPKRSATLHMLVDSGASSSVVPGSILRDLGVRPSGTDVFTLVDGRRIRRQVGAVWFRVGGRRAASTVVFGRRGDDTLLGIVALEELRLTLDPKAGQLRPLGPQRL